MHVWFVRYSPIRITVSDEIPVQNLRIDGLFCWPWRSNWVKWKIRKLFLTKLSAYQQNIIIFGEVD